MSSTNPDRSSDEIRRDIERTRAQMDETVDELKDRLSPGQLVDEVWSSFRSSGRSAGDVLRDHAVPLALMGLGVAWLAVEEKTGHSYDAHRIQRGYEAGRSGYGGYDEYDEGEEQHGLRDRASGAVDSVKDAAHSVKETARDAKHWVGDKLDRASEVGGRTKDAAHRATHAVKRTGRDTRNFASSTRRRASTLLENSPLTMGAICFGIGLASGLAVPATHAEDELMGDRSDKMKRQAKDRARELKDESKHLAASAVEGAKDEVENYSREHFGKGSEQGDDQDRFRASGSTSGQDAWGASSGGGAGTGSGFESGQDRSGSGFESSGTGSEFERERDRSRQDFGEPGRGTSGGPGNPLV